MFLINLLKHMTFLFEKKMEKFSHFRILTMPCKFIEVRRVSGCDVTSTIFQKNILAWQ